MHTNTPAYHHLTADLIARYPDAAEDDYGFLSPGDVVVTYEPLTSLWHDYPYFGARVPCGLCMAESGCLYFLTVAADGSVICAKRGRAHALPMTVSPFTPPAKDF